MITMVFKSMRLKYSKTKVYFDTKRYLVKEPQCITYKNRKILFCDLNI